MKLVRLNQDWNPFSLLPEDYDFAHSPQMDFREDESKYMIKADLPGIKKEDLNITVTGSTLVFKGERKQESEKDEKGWHHTERWYGSFERVLELPSEVDASKVKASFKDGVLEITLPKAESAKPKQIEVDIN
jgi:HSP20 family protein